MQRYGLMPVIFYRTTTGHFRSICGSDGLA